MYARSVWSGDWVQKRSPNGEPGEFSTWTYDAQFGTISWVSILIFHFSEFCVGNAEMAVLGLLGVGIVVHECGLGTAQPCHLPIWDRHRDIFANMPLPGFKWCPRHRPNLGPAATEIQCRWWLTDPKIVRDPWRDPQRVQGKPLPGWQMELFFCFPEMVEDFRVTVESFQINSSLDKFLRPAVLVIGGAWQQVVHDVTRPATDCREYSLGTLLTTLDALKKTTLEPTWLQMAGGSKDYAPVLELITNN